VIIPAESVTECWRWNSWRRIEPEGCRTSAGLRVAALNLYALSVLSSSSIIYVMIHRISDVSTLHCDGAGTPVLDSGYDRVCCNCTTKCVSLPVVISINYALLHMACVRVSLHDFCAYCTHIFTISSD
jgi:hypothetical protein